MLFIQNVFDNEKLTTQLFTKQKESINHFSAFLAFSKFANKKRESL